MKNRQLHWNSLFFLLLCMSSCLLAQSPTAPIKRIETLGTLHEGKVYIRWVPSDIDFWKIANQKGYRITRSMVKEGDDELPLGKRLSTERVVADNLRPLDKGAWGSFTSNAAKIAEAMLYEDQIEVQFEGKSDLASIVNTNQARDNRFAFAMLAASQDFEVAKAMGLGFEDADTEPKNTYYYAIEVIDFNIADYNAGALFIKPEEAGQSTLPIIAKPSAELGNQKALLQWNNKNADKYYLGYNIEWTTLGSNNYQRLNNTPIVFGGSEDVNLDYVQYGVKLPDNKTTLVYRIKGISYFGFDSEPSDTIRIKGKPDPLQAELFIKDLTELKPKGSTISTVSIKWAFAKNMENEITHFDIFRSKSHNGTYSKVNTTPISTALRFFEDKDPLRTNYYKIVSYDRNGYILSSIAQLMQLDDETPPPTPLKVTGDMNKEGLVVLHWLRSVAEDMHGYRVYVSNHPTDYFMEVTSEAIADSFYVYQANMQTLNTKIYFTVKSADYRENLSPRSEICAIERPDIFPPDAPVITKVENYGNGVRLEWNLSLAEDVVEYALERRERGIVGWKQMLKFDPNQVKYFMFDDSTSKKSGTEYDYRLSAKDDVGLIGDSRIHTIKAMNAKKRVVVTRVASQFYQYQPNAAFFWYIPHGPNYINTSELVSFEIYRAVDDPQKSVLIKVLPVIDAQANFTLMQYPYTQDYNYRNFQQISSQGYGFPYACLDDDIDFANFKALTYYWVPIAQPNGLQAWVKYTIPNPSTLGSGEHYIYYRVIAKYTDGTSSTISPYTMTKVN
jgi:uncharacterized protein